MGITVRSAILRSWPAPTATIMREIDTIVDRAHAALGSCRGRNRLVHVTLACRGGRHRSVAASEDVAARRTGAIVVEVQDHHMGRPVVGP